MTDKTNQIKNNDVYKQILKDSCGGVMYNVAKQNSYKSTEIIQIWDSMTESEKSATCGIMKGAVEFLKGN